jgi:hypothetical protein
MPDVKKLLSPLLIPLAVVAGVMYVLAWSCSLFGYLAEVAYEVTIALLGHTIDAMESLVDYITGRAHL